MDEYGTYSEVYQVHLTDMGRSLGCIEYTFGWIVPILVTLGILLSSLLIGDQESMYPTYFHPKGYFRRAAPRPANKALLKGGLHGRLTHGISCRYEHQKC